MPSEPRAVEQTRGPLLARAIAYVIDNALELGVPLLGVLILDLPIAVFWIAALVFGLGNRMVLEGQTGQSVGKRVMQLRVMTMSAERPGIGRAAIRYVLLCVDAVALALPALVSMLISNRRQRLGDRAAKTMVVNNVMVAIDIPRYADTGVGEPVTPGLMMDLPGPDGEDPRSLRTSESWAAGWYTDPDAPGSLRWHDGEQFTAGRRPAVVEEGDVPALKDLGARSR